MTIRQLCFSSLIGLALAGQAYAVEVTPNIGFRQFSAPNGSQYDTNSEYRARVHNNSQTAMNSQFSQFGKLVPDFNSVGLDFTFKVE